MTRHYGSQSMVAPLRTVLVKRPEQAFAVSDPVAWHYTGRPDVTIAQHDIYRLSARYHGEEKARRQVQEKFSKEKRVTLRLKPEHIIEYFE